MPGGNAGYEELAGGLKANQNGEVFCMDNNSFFLTGGASVAIFVLVTEFVGVRHRSMMGMSLWYCWSISLMALAGLGYLIRDWRMLSIATSVPGIPALLCWL